MIISAIKTIGILTAFFFMLSVNFNKKPLFMHLYSVISPVTIFAQNEAEKFISKSISGAQSYSRKIFENSVPKVKDSIKSKLSGRQKTGSEPAERITIEEKKELDQLIKNH